MSSDAEAGVVVDRILEHKVFEHQSSDYGVALSHELGEILHGVAPDASLRTVLKHRRW